MRYWNNIVRGCLVAAIFTLLGCGGDGGTTSQTTISGTVSEGAALAAGSTVYLKDSKGVEKTTVIEGDNGSFSIGIDGLTAPYVLKAGNYYSFAKAPGTVNINPFTHLCIVNTLGATDVATFYGDAAKPPDAESLIRLAIKYQQNVDDLKTKIDALYASTVPASQRDFLNGTIVIGQGVDKIYENIEIISTASSFTIKKKGQSNILLFGIRDLTSGTVTLAKDDDAIAVLNNILYPKVATIQVIPTGSGVYSIVAKDLSGVAGIQLDIAYDKESLSIPTVTQGGFATGAMFAANTKIPGLIKIAIIGAYDFSGSGQVAVISFASKTGSGGISSITASLVDSSGVAVPVSASNISNPSGATIKAISSGDGTYSIQANNMDGVSGIQLDITYDSSSLATPTVSAGELVAGALFVANTSTPGLIKIGIVSTSAFSGSGQIVKISFSSKTGSGGITGIKANIIDGRGATLPVQADLPTVS